MRSLVFSVLALSPVLASCEANATHPEDHAPYDAGEAGSLSCVPNQDGIIEPSEIQAALGVSVKYLVSPAGKTRMVDVAGTTDSGGHLVWDWGTDYADDQVAQIAASSLTGKWYAPSFPTGQFAAPFDAGDTIEAVYSQDASGLYLQGLASTQPKPKTLLVYDQPVVLYKLPLQVGATWTSTGNVKNGTLMDNPWVETDTYVGTDDATGQLVLPQLTFAQAHRVRFDVTLAPAVGMNVTKKQVSFLFECFGEVGRATSQNGEMTENFTTAVEERRFGL
jgi:hypothetical protein